VHGDRRGGAEGELRHRRPAGGLRDDGLLEVVSACEGETATQMQWLRTRMKQAAPQALVVA